MQLWHSLVLPATLLLAISFFTATEVQGAPATFKLPNYYSESNSDPYPEVVMDILSRIGQSLINQREGLMEKRGMDLGVGRGYSGSMAAKQLMGLASANYASGPGRKRRAAPLA